MSTKRKPAKKRDPNQDSNTGKPEEAKGAIVARAALRPNIQAAVTLIEYGKAYGDLDLYGLIDELKIQTKVASGGDLGRGEEMLTAQAHTLDAIFNNLARRAINAEHSENFDRFLKFSLRAQSQCRATWETLSSMKNPPMVGYVKQTNIAHGHQQVNNAPSETGDAPHALENANLQNKLLEQNDGERLDFGAAGTAGRANPAMAPLGKGDRTKDAAG